MKSPLKNFLMFSVGTWTNAAVSVASIPIITWFLDPDELGKGTMFILAYNLLLNIFLLGQDQSYARHFNEVSGRHRDRLLAETVTTSLLFTTLVVIGLQLFKARIAVLLFEDASKTGYITLLAFIVVVGVINRFIQLRLRMENKALAYSFLQILLTSLNLLFTILYAWYGRNDFTAVILGFATSHFVCLLAGLGMDYSSWWGLFRSSPLKSEMLHHLRYGSPFVPTFIFDWIFQSADRTFLRLYSTFTEIGIYTTAARISSALNVIQSGFNTFWVPFVFEKYSKDPSDNSFYEVAFESVYLVFSVMILIILLLQDVIFLILPADYHASIHLFPLLLFVPMFYTLSEITSVGINLKRRTSYHFYILMTTSLISIGLGYFLIRTYGAIGAIITNFVSYMCFFLLRTILSGRLYPLPLKWTKFVFTFILVFIPVLYVFLFPLSKNYLLVVISLLSVFIYHRKMVLSLLKRL